MIQKVFINFSSRQKLYYFVIKSTKYNKHIVLKEIPEQIYHIMYFSLFLFFIISMSLLALTFVFEIWSIKMNHIKKIENINKELSKKGLSYVEKRWFFQENVQLTDWSECLFLQLPGIIWLLGTLWIIYAILEQGEHYARKISKFVVFKPKFSLTEKEKNVSFEYFIKIL